MNKGRHYTREEVMKSLFKVAFHEHLQLDDFLKDMDQDLRESEKEYFTKVVTSFVNHKNEIDTLIEKSATGWKFSRIAKVDLAILRVAVTELLYVKDIPKEVVVNEAMELSKEYSSDDSYSFINGLLGHIISEIS